ncbi:hypothetical protein EJV44_21245 [Ancylobacter aquaticus]|nr:hypothetical protein EJV44_21245 [Ancylobacter aquaticus]
MIDLPRHPPSMLPVIRTVPEHAATGELKRRYDAVKSAFDVPWMGVVAMAHTQYPRFFDALWEGLEPIAGTRAFQDACRAMRAATEAGVERSLGISPLAHRLQDLGYDPREIGEIRTIIEVFSHGNYPYILLATVSRYLLSGGDLSGEPQVFETSPRSPHIFHQPILMEPHHADEHTRGIFADIQATLALPILNTDYRALARWPSYFHLAWAELRPLIRTPSHAALSQQLHEQAIAVLRTLPNPARLKGDMVRAAAADDVSLAQVRAMTELFQWLLPELAVNVAVFRAQVQ